MVNPAPVLLCNYYNVFWISCT